MAEDKLSATPQAPKKWFDENYCDPILSDEEHQQLCDHIIEYVIGEAIASIAGAILNDPLHRTQGVRARHRHDLGLLDKSSKAYREMCERAVKAARNYLLQRVVTEAHSEKYGALTILKHYQLLSKGDPSSYPELEEPYETHIAGVCAFLEFASQHFAIDEKGKIQYPGATEPQWVYGGPRWAEVAEAGLHLWRATSEGNHSFDSGEVQVLMHTALQKMHNRGRIFGGRIRGFLDLADSESLEHVVSNVDKFTTSQNILDRLSKQGTEWQTLQGVVRGSAGIPAVDEIYRAQMTATHRDFMDPDSNS